MKIIEKLKSVSTLIKVYSASAVSLGIGIAFATGSVGAFFIAVGVCGIIGCAIYAIEKS